jgi:hypothetical protein
MSVQVKKIQHPRGITRTLYRFPIWLFRLHLGWLFMGRFLLLTHVGRKSGLPRQTLLEILQYDREKERYVVFAGWGSKPIGLKMWRRRRKKQGYFVLVGVWGVG